MAEIEIQPGIIVDGVDPTRIELIRSISTAVTTVNPGAVFPSRRQRSGFTLRRRRVPTKVHLAVTSGRAMADKWQGKATTVLRVDAEGDCPLPGAETEVARRIQQAMVRAVAAPKIGVVHGDSLRGGDICLAPLVELLNPVVVDCRGSGPGVLGVDPGTGIRWADIDQSERVFPVGIENHFPDVEILKGQKTRVLGADSRAGGCGNTSLVAAILHALTPGTAAVCHLGIWGSNASEVSKDLDVVFLVANGARDDVENLAGRLTAWKPRCGLVVLLTGRCYPLAEKMIRLAVDSGGKGIPHLVLQTRRWPRALRRSLKSALAWCQEIEGVWHDDVSNHAQ